MESMLDPRSLAAEPTDEEEYDEDPEEMERKFQEAEMLNQQLKQMLAAAEQDERRQMAQMRRQAAPQRGARGSSGSFGIPPRSSSRRQDRHGCSTPRRMAAGAA